MDREREGDRGIHTHTHTQRERERGKNTALGQQCQELCSGSWELCTGPQPGAVHCGSSRELCIGAAAELCTGAGAVRPGVAMSCVLGQ